MKETKRAEDGTIEDITRLIELSGLNYSSVVNQDLRSGKYFVTDGFVSAAELRFSKSGLILDLFKSPRVEDDAIIFLIEDNSNKLCLKMLPDVWIATAENVRQPGFFEKISKSKYLPTVYFSKVSAPEENVMYLYDYVGGVTLSKMVSEITSRQKLEILKSLNECINELVLKYQLDINFNSGYLDNFIVNPADLSDIVLIDLNIAFQASGVVPLESLLRIVKRRALKILSNSVFDRTDVYNALYVES